VAFLDVTVLRWVQGYGITMVDISSELFGLSTLFLKNFFSKHIRLHQHVETIAQFIKILIRSSYLFVFDFLMSYYIL
jgi:UV DNA damage repair endonuclease